MRNIPFIFENCITVVKPDNGYCETLFDDRSIAPSLPIYNNYNKWISLDLGYPKGNKGIKLMTIHREILYTFISESFGKDYSERLWAVAHHAPPSELCLFEEEEALVLSFQKYLNTDKAIIDPILELKKFEKLKQLFIEGKRLVSIIN